MSVERGEGDSGNGADMLRLDYFVCGVVGLEKWVGDFSDKAE